MIDRVVVQLLENDVGAVELDRTRSVRTQAMRHAGDDVVGIGHVRNDVAGEYRVGFSVLRHDPPGDVQPEELGERRDAVLLGHGRDVLRGIDPEHAVAALGKPLQERPVVARHLDDTQRAGTAALDETVAEHRAVAARSSDVPVTHT